MTALPYNQSNPLLPVSCLAFYSNYCKATFLQSQFRKNTANSNSARVRFLPESSLLCFPVALELHPACRFLAINLHSTGLCFDWRDKCQSKRAGESREQFRQKSKICLHFERDQDVRGVAIQRGIARPFQVVSLIFKKVN